MTVQFAMYSQSICCKYFFHNRDDCGRFAYAPPPIAAGVRPGALLPLFGAGGTGIAQDLAAPAEASLADDAFPLHALDQIGGAVVADGETPLQVAGRCLALTQHDVESALVELTRRGTGPPSGPVRLLLR